MSLSNTTGDADIDAVLGGSQSSSAASTQSLTGDPDVDAVLSSTSGGLSSTPVDYAKGFTKGTIRGTAYQNISAVGPGDLINPATWRHAYQAVTEIPDKVSGIIDYLKDNPVLHPQDVVMDQIHRLGQLSPEDQGFVVGPQVASAAIPLGGAVLRGIRALSAGEDVASFPGGARSTVEPVWASSPQSMGAAASAAGGADITSASAPLQAAYRDAVASGRTPNPEVLSRHVEADSLPVPMQLTEGQATQDPNIISREMNRRGVSGLSTFLSDQDAKLRDNLRVIRDQTGPDVFSTNPVEHGDTLIDAYKEKDAPIVADIEAKYKALNDAAGGDFPVDGKTFAENARDALKKKLKSNFLPAGIESDLSSFERGDPMTFEQFEAMRTNLASEMRDNPSGNARAAAGIVREQLENLPLRGGAENLKPLADAARQAARARFEALAADPAYKAAVEGSVPPDRFVNRFVLNGQRDQVATMRNNLAGNDRAVQTMGVATLDDLRQSAGIDSKGNGAFNQARFNKRLEALDPKIQYLLPSDQLGHVRTLGEVSRYAKSQPPGHVINNSNTFSGALADSAKDLGMDAVTNVLNAKTGVAGTILRKGIEKFSSGAELKQATKPLAGAFDKD